MAAVSLTVPNHFRGWVNLRLNRIFDRHRISFYGFVCLTWLLVGISLLATFLSPTASNYQTLTTGLHANLFPVIGFYIILLGGTTMIDLCENRPTENRPNFHPFWLLFLFSLAPVIALYLMIGKGL